MKNENHPITNHPQDADRRAAGFSGGPRLESLTQKATEFVSGPWGTIALFGVLASWAVTIPFVGWVRAYERISEFITVASFILLFLIQRSQSKGIAVSTGKTTNKPVWPPTRGMPKKHGIEERITAICRDRIYPPLRPQISAIIDNPHVAEIALAVLRVDESPEAPHAVNGYPARYSTPSNSDSTYS
jgi:hypothetical protein